MHSDYDDFHKIEQKRRKNAKKQIDKLIERRKLLNEKILIEIGELKTKNENVELEINKFKQENSKFKSSTETNLNGLPSQIENEMSLDKSDIRYDDILNVSNVEKNIQKEEKRTSTLFSFENHKLNIKISNFFLKNYVYNDFFIITEKKLQDEKNEYNKLDLLKIKMIVNKRIGQITSDHEHILQIVEILQKNYNLVCCEFMIVKILEQAKIQITNYFESYKSYGIFLSRMYTPEMHSLLLMCLLHKMETGNILKSLYSVYFELLRLKKFFSEAHNFLVSILNEPPEFNIFYVIESFLLILGSDMLNSYGIHFKGIIKYIRNEYLTRNYNEPSQVRIETILSNLA